MDKSRVTVSKTWKDNIIIGHHEQHTLLNHVYLVTGKKMFEPAVTIVFANVNLPLFVYFSSSFKLKYFFLSFEVNFTIFKPISSEQLLLSK